MNICLLHLKISLSWKIQFISIYFFRIRHCTNFIALLSSICIGIPLANFYPCLENNFDNENNRFRGENIRLSYLTWLWVALSVTLV